MENRRPLPRPVRALIFVFAVGCIIAYVSIMSCGGASKRGDFLPATKAPAGPPMLDQQQRATGPRFLGGSKSAPVFRPEDLPVTPAPAAQPQQTAPRPR